jgi:hypothetical protein
MDARLAAQLDVTRATWRLRDADLRWLQWVAETTRKAFRERAPALSALRIHSLPGTLWEVLRDSSGQPWLIADDELTACLAELSLLSTGRVQAESGYDRMILMLADGFRAADDTRRYIACLGWARPRVRQIQMLRQSALSVDGVSVAPTIILLHEMAHHIAGVHTDAGGVLHMWRQVCEASLAKLLGAIEHGDIREKLLQQGLAFGLERAEAEAQLDAYAGHLRTSDKMRTELLCDLVATVGFLNLRAQGDTLSNDGLVEGVTAKEVGDAFFIAHGAIQNMQLIVAIQDVAASVSRPADYPQRVPATIAMELVARSSALAFALSSLLEFWCVTGRLTDDVAHAIARGEPVFARSIARRNQIRNQTVLAPLEALNSALLSGEPFDEFERQALEHLRDTGLDAEPDLSRLDAARWALTLSSDHDAGAGPSGHQP